MADETLQAFQLGASLFDRAQTQKRMMEQMQMQTADQLMRQRQYDLQNKIQSNAYAQALEEQANQTAEYDAFQKFNEDVANYLNDPVVDSKMPVLPRFKSKTFNQNAIQAYQGLQQYSPRAKLAKSREQYESKRISNAADMLSTFGVDVFDENGRINEQLYQANIPRLNEEKRLSGYSQDVRSAFSQTDKALPFDQRVGEAIKLAKERGKSPTERTQERNAELAVSEYTSAFGKPDEQTDAFIRNNALTGRWKTPEGTAEKRILGDETISSSASMLADQLENFEKKFGAGAIQKYVGLIDGKVEELKRKISSAKTEEEKQAYALLQRFQSNFNTVAFEKSGKAVTSQEMERLKAALGNIQSNNFADDVRNFASLAAEDYYGTIRSFKDKYRITPTQVRQANELVAKYRLPFTPFGQQQQAAPAAVSQEQSISPQDVFKNIRANRPKGGTIQPTTPPASNRVGRFEMFIEGQ
jgi:23S rRNA pseudoU1915 N3-methylase RlmH